MQKQTEEARESCAGSPCKYYHHGACHKLTPTLAWSRDSALAVRLESYWPSVRPDDWCGGFEADDRPKPEPPKTPVDKYLPARPNEFDRIMSLLRGDGLSTDSPLNILAKKAEAEHAAAAETLYRTELAKRRRAREGGV